MKPIFQSIGSVLALAMSVSTMETHAQSPGSLDLRFQPSAFSVLKEYEGGGAIRIVGLRSDERVIIEGLFSHADGKPRGGIAQLNADGTLDPGFNPAISILSTTRLSVKGVRPPMTALTATEGLFVTALWNPTDWSESDVVQLMPDGSLADFRVRSPLIWSASSFWERIIFAQSDGRLLVGAPVAYGKTHGLYDVSRFDGQGYLDFSFNLRLQWELCCADIASVYALMEIAAQPDGKLLIYGPNIRAINGVTWNNLARINADGSLDTSFRLPAGWQAPGEFLSRYAFHVLPDGKVLAGGLRNTQRAYYPLVRLHSDGSIDRAFKAGSSLGKVDAMAVQPDGRIVVATGESGDDGSPHSSRRILRLHPDGSKDTQFGQATATTGSPGFEVINSIALQPDGKILVAGSFTSINGIRRPGIARLHGDPPPAFAFASVTREPSGSVRFIIPTRPGGPYILDGSTDLQSWLPIRTNSATDLTLEFKDANAVNFTQRFYRARLVNP